MTTMIERVARAMATRHYSLRFDGNDELTRHNVEGNWQTFADDAAAAITAMRESTDLMRDLMNDVCIDGPDYVSFYPSLHDCGRLWSAGIDAALAEQQS